MSTPPFHPARLDRMHDVLAAHVDNGLAPGLVTLVRRHGETHVDVIGSLAFDRPEPMRRDTIFRIASITKPIVAVAAMILVEESRLRLDEPVDRLLPELADRRVLKAIDGPIDETVPAGRQITVRDCLTFRPGIGMLFEAMQAAPGTYPIHDALVDAEVVGGPPDPSISFGPDEWIRRLGEFPLMYQPGERWLYNTGSEILGVLIARASGQSFERFLAERIFEPLGMTDTAFYVPAEKVERFATAYNHNYVTGSLDVTDDPRSDSSPWTRPPALPSGGGGLVSTVDDLAAFAEMMLRQGSYDGRQVLSRLSVRAMTTDQLTPRQKSVSGFFPEWFDARGWGLGLSVGTAADGLELPGRFGWDGGSGTSWYSCPAEDLTAILLTQRGDFPTMSPVYLDFWNSVYASVV